MGKYVIVKQESRTGGDYPVWVAYRVIFGMWGILTYVTNALSITSAEDCEQSLYNILHKKPEKKAK